MRRERVRPWLISGMGAVALIIAASAHPAPASAPLEFVIGNEALAASGEHLAAHMDAFVRRLEKVGGWRLGSLRGKAFVNPGEALAYVRANKVPFAILPVHQFVQARKDLKLEPLGRAVYFDGSEPAYWGLTRNGKRPYERVEDFPGLRLAMTEIGDLRWISVLFEGTVPVLSHFKYVRAASDKAAVDAVLAGKADLAMVYETYFNTIKARVGPEGDLAWVYTSAPMPPFPAVAVGKFAAKADTKKMTAALGNVCRDEGAGACARMAILYMQMSGTGQYFNITEKYRIYPVQ